MRKRFPVVLAANARWPDAQVAGIGFPFNWVKVDNKGTGKVDIALSPPQVQGDLIASYATISSGKVRVFNLAGPRNPDGTLTEDWPDQVYLMADATGCTIMLEVADHPIVDLVLTT